MLTYLSTIYNLSYIFANFFGWFLVMIMRFSSFHGCFGEPCVRRAFLTLPGGDLSRKAHDRITFSVGPGRHMEVRQGPVVHYFPIVASPEDSVRIPMANRRQLCDVHIQAVGFAQEKVNQARFLQVFAEEKAIVFFNLHHLQARL